MRIPSVSNPRPSGVSQGTPGGRAGNAAGAVGNTPRATRGGRQQLQMGDEVYLWILIGVEIGITAYARNYFNRSRQHGG